MPTSALPRAYARARYAASSLKHHRSLVAVSRARETLRSFADLNAEVDATVTDASAIIAMPSLLDSRSVATAQFHADRDAAQQVIDGTNSATEMERMESAVLSAVLSWRVARDSARMKLQRGVHADGSRYAVDDRLALDEARTAVQRGAACSDVINILNKTGFCLD